MNASTSLALLRRVGVPVVRTSDAATALRQSPFAASQTMRRLAAAGLVQSVRHGAWWVDGDIDPYRLPEHLTAPMPSYLSLYTALHLRGLIEQIPAVFYAVSLARSQRVATASGTFSIHRVTPVLFGGFDETPSGVKLATPEKALFDLAYLSAGRSRLFTTLPELELPRRFRRAELKRWITAIPSARGRTLTSHRLDEWLARAT